jgi:hypothetical protein
LAQAGGGGPICQGENSLRETAEGVGRLYINPAAMLRHTRKNAKNRAILVFGTRHALLLAPPSSLE